MISTRSLACNAATIRLMVVVLPVPRRQVGRGGRTAKHKHREGREACRTFPRCAVLFADAAEEVYCGGM
jgi:hypothetical protein